MEETAFDRAMTVYVQQNNNAKQLKALGVITAQEFVQRKRQIINEAREKLNLDPLTLAQVQEIVTALGE